MDAAVTDCYDAHGIAFFRLSCTLNAQDKKDFIPPKKWQLLSPTDPTMRRAGNAVGIRCGPPARPEGRHIIVMDADGADAIDIVMRMLERTCAAGFHARVPQVQTQRGPGGRHFYFFAEPGSLASTLGSRAGLDIAGVKTGVDIRAGYRGKETNESVGFVFAPPTTLKPGAKPRAYTLLPGPAIHEAPFMPEALARAIAAGGCPCAGAEAAAARQEGLRPQVPTEATDDAPLRSGPSPEGGEGGLVPAIAAAGLSPLGPLTQAQEAAFKREALRAVVARAGTDRVGYPDSVELIANAEPVFGCPAVCIKFRFAPRTSRVCPVTHVEHGRNNINVTLGVDMKRTGLPAFFVYCYSEKCVSAKTKQKEPKMLGLVDTASYAELGIVCSGVSRRSAPTRSLGQTIVLLGEMQKSIDRLIENPGASGAWGTVTALGEIACALFTAASAFPSALSCAKDMLDQLVAASTLTDAEKGLAARGFQHAKRGSQTLDPLMKLRGYAEGLLGTREQELMAVREAITAHTDPALEANVPLAAENLLKALDTLVYVGADGTQDGYTDVEYGGEFVFYVWNRVARLSFDSWQTSTEKKHEFYLFNGATYKPGQKDEFVRQAFVHLKHIAEALREVPSLRIRAEKLVKRIAGAGDYFIKLTHYVLAEMQGEVKLAACGHISPSQFHDQLDAGPYIGFTNGVKDTERDIFMPIGQVGRNVLVSMTTKYPYVYPDDPRVVLATTEITSYYATLFSADAGDAEDPLLLQAQLTMGSFVYPANVAKKIHVFLGHEGNNGKSAFAKFLGLTFGDYYGAGNIGALTPGPRETLDVELVRNCKKLVVAFPEAQSSDRDGHSMNLKLDSGKLKVMTGNDTVIARIIYHMPKDVDIMNTPFMGSNNMPELDHGDPVACERVRVTRFGSTFSSGPGDRARRVYKCVPDLKSKLTEWAPFHMLMLLGWLRLFNAAGRKLDAGDEHAAGSFANLAVLAQTPEGKLRCWVEANYTRVADKANGTKLEDLYTAYTAMAPPVHTKVLGKILFAKMLELIYPGIGGHRGKDGSKGIFLLR